MSRIGTQEGERCNRENDEGFACDGEMTFLGGRDCSCHISPPCGSCLKTGLRCNVCDALPEDGE